MEKEKEKHPRLPWIKKKKKKKPLRSTTGKKSYIRGGTASTTWGRSCH